MERRTAPLSASQESEPESGAKEAAARAAEESTKVVQTAGEQTREVAGTVKEQAVEVVETAKQQGRNLAHEAREQLRQQASSQTERMAEALRNVGTQVQALADGRTEDAGGTRDYAHQAANTVQEWAGRVESRGFQGLTQDLERVARRRPGVFLAGAAGAGFLIGRFLRSSSGSGGSAGGGNEASNWRPPPAMERAESMALPVDAANSLVGGFAPLESDPAVGSGR